MSAPILTCYDDRAYKYLSDNRERYFAQSAATRNGVVAPIPARPRLPASDLPSDVGAGQLHTNTAGASPARQEIPR